MKKKHQQDIESALSNALEPPQKRKPSPALNDILSQFAPPETTRLNSTQVESTQLDSTRLSPSTAEPIKAPIAPERDFNRRPNSLERDALPKGLFPGTSKKLYDALYLRTRGAVKPVRSIKATRTEVMRWAGIGGLNTFLAHIKHLTRVGLIVREFEIGDKEGAIYEVQIPEELDSTQLDSTQLNSTQDNSPSKRVHDSTQKVMRVESSQTVDYAATSSPPNTSFKTNTEIDDEKARAPEGLSDLCKILDEATQKLTGKPLKAGERERWAEVARVLVAELEIAAARTTVSSVPSFLAEHLRRRLWKIDKKQARAEGKELPDETVTDVPPEDVSNCPDCRGSGWWYPQGTDKGVAKCKHEKLKQ